jgi:hypothetical protein
VPARPMVNEPDVDFDRDVVAGRESRAA